MYARMYVSERMEILIKEESGNKKHIITEGCLILPVLIKQILSINCHRVAVLAFLPNQKYAYLIYIIEGFIYNHVFFNSLNSRSKM